jgi:Protein of unknown function (DUF429)
MMHTLGVDLAASVDRSAMVVVEWHPEGARVESCLRGVDDEVIVEALGRADGAGVNAPFGWPVEMVGALTGYAKEAVWSAPSREDFRYRRTDVHVHDVVREQCELGLWPMSVAAERTAMRAFRLAGIRELHAEAAGSRFARDGSDGIVEVSPMASLTLWGLEGQGFRSGRREERRDACERLLGAIRARALYLEIPDPVRVDMAADPDRLDALVAALVARAALEGMTLESPEEEKARAMAEGWIHLPEADCLPALHRGKISAMEDHRARAEEVAAERWGLASRAEGAA